MNLESRRANGAGRIMHRTDSEFGQADVLAMFGEMVTWLGSQSFAGALRTRLARGESGWRWAENRDGRQPSRRGHWLYAVCLRFDAALGRRTFTAIEGAWE